MAWTPEDKGRVAFLIPFLAFFGVFWLVPLLAGLGWSLTLTDASGARSWVGWENFEHVLSDGRFWKSVRNTALYAGAVIAITLPLALGLALLLRGTWRRAQPVLVVGLLLPALTAPFVLGLVFYLFFHGRQGGLNQMLVMPLGLRSINWLKDPDWILPAMVFQSVWRWVGLVAFLLLCSLDGLPTHRREAARLDGAGAWSRFRWVVLPHAGPVLGFSAVYLVVDCVVTYAGAVGLLGGSGGTADAGLLVVTYAHQMAFKGRGFEAATTTSLVIAVMLLVVLVALIFAWRIRCRRAEIRSGGGMGLGMFAGWCLVVWVAASALLGVFVFGLVGGIGVVIAMAVLGAVFVWRRARMFGRTALMAGIAGLLMYPYVWMTLASFKTDRELYKPMDLWPDSFRGDFLRRLFVGEEFGFVASSAGALQVAGLVLGAVAFVWAAFRSRRLAMVGAGVWLALFLASVGLRANGWAGPFGQVFANTLLVAGLQALLATTVAALAGFALATGTRDAWTWGLVAAAAVLILIPKEALGFPLFQWMQKLGLRDSLAALVLPGVASGIGVLFFWQLARQLPRDVLDAVRVSGGSEWAVAREGLTLMLPGLLTYGVIHFIWAWHEHLLPLLLVDGEEQRTLSVALSSVWSSSRDYPRAMIMAAGMFTVVPVVVLFAAAYGQFRSALAELMDVD